MSPADMRPPAAGQCVRRSACRQRPYVGGRCPVPGAGSLGVCDDAVACGDLVLTWLDRWDTSRELEELERWDDFALSILTAEEEADLDNHDLPWLSPGKVIRTIEDGCGGGQCFAIPTAVRLSVQRS